MGRMFMNCRSLNILDLSNFNTSGLTYMADMFYGCTSLSFLNLSNFDTSNVVNMESVFYNCPKLEYINLKIGIKKTNVYRFGISDTPKNVLLCSYDKS
jgi:surface protein